MSVGTLTRAAPPARQLLTRALNANTIGQHRTIADLGIGGSPKLLSAHRTLPYAAMPVFDLITSIESYPDYIPFCTAAHISAFSKPDKHYQRKWPQKASLSIGYTGQFQVNESFTSRVYCAPPVSDKGRAGVGIVEAISGDAHSTIDKTLVEHHTSDPAEDLSGPLEFLRTRWTVRDYPYKPGPDDASVNPQEVKAQPQSRNESRTDVGLSLEFRFRNPLYDAMARAVATTVAEKMIDAFVRRVESVMAPKKD